MNLLFSALFLLFPALDVNWSSTPGVVRIAFRGEDEFINRCAQSGLEVRYEFEIKLCRERGLWFDVCAESLREIRTFRYDPISESYLLRRDRLGDSLPPVTDAAPDRQRAFQFVQSTTVTIDVMESPPGFSRGARGDYLAVRSHARCRSEQSGTFERLSSILSFGIVGPGILESGWVRYNLEGSEQR